MIQSKMTEMWKWLPINISIFCRKPFYKITVPTVDTVRYEGIICTLLKAGLPALITGPVGTGKTSTAQSVTSTFDPMKFTILNFNMSAMVIRTC